MHSNFDSNNRDRLVVYILQFIPTVGIQNTRIKVWRNKIVRSQPWNRLVEWIELSVISRSNFCLYFSYVFDSKSRGSVVAALQ